MSKGGFVRVSVKGERKAAEHARPWRAGPGISNVWAKRFTGEAYCMGRGVTQDYVRAYKWMALAKSTARPGDFNYRACSTYIKTYLLPHMSPAQIAKAQALAYAWAKAHEK